MISRENATFLLGVIAVLYLGAAALYAVNTPPWQAPDEPAHYNYVRQIVEEDCCPVNAAGDWDSAHLETLKSEGFPEGADLSAIQYEDHQPPLYYLLAAPVYRATGGSLVALRLLSVVFGLGVVLAAYYTVLRLLPERPVLALGAALVAAFVPQHVAIMASVNNDSLAEMLMGIIFVVAITYLRNPSKRNKDGTVTPFDVSHLPHAAALGGLVGAAYLTKMTIYLPATLVVAAAILLRWLVEKAPLRWLVLEGLWAALMAAGLGSIWWARNVILYGWPDLFGQIAHLSVVQGQLRTADYIASVGTSAYVQSALKTTYQSFWGQFGWMGVPMPPREYIAIGAFLLIALAGFVLLVTAYRRRLALNVYQRAGIGVMVLGALATLAGYVYYNVTFVQFQGRYLFPLLIPFALFVVLGLTGVQYILEVWLKGRAWDRRLNWLPVIGVSWMPLLSLFALFNYVLPNLR